jgi:beta-glucanase (GH16 family)
LEEKFIFRFNLHLYFFAVEGAWPAIWTLGADFETNILPAAGEIDIMEHVGNQQDKVF